MERRADLGRNVVVYAENDDLGDDVCYADTKKDLGIIKGYLARQLHDAERNGKVLDSAVHDAEEKLELT
jgi:hypothetical protein